MTERHGAFPTGHRGVVNNSVTGTVGGTLIQAGDITGGLTFGDGPGLPSIVQVGQGNDYQAVVSSPVEVTAQLAADIETYLEQMSDADLGQRSSRASELLRELRAQV